MIPKKVNDPKSLQSTLCASYPFVCGKQSLVGSLTFSLLYVLYDEICHSASYEVFCAQAVIIILCPDTGILIYSMLYFNGPESGM